jgi:hypothetical protein
MNASSLHADETRVGASFVAKRTTANPRQIVVRLVESRKGATKDELFEEFREELDADPDMRRAVEWYFFVNMYEYQVTSRNSRKPVLAPKQNRQEQIEALKSRVVQVVLLDLKLPTGKLLRESTFAECARAGGFFAKIAKKGQPKQIVGKVLTEEQLRGMLS